jgi:hypothetical protein
MRCIVDLLALLTPELAAAATAPIREARWCEEAVPPPRDPPPAFLNEMRLPPGSDVNMAAAVESSSSPAEGLASDDMDQSGSTAASAQSLALETLE